MTTITATLQDGIAVRLEARDHVWSADEPEAAGGTDTGPTPYELLLGSLAACTCTTLALYCRHKGIRLDRVEASFQHDRVHARDCEDCEDDRRGFIDRIQSHVRLSGDFDEQQRKRLTQIVSRCPVHKTLENRPTITDEVEFVG